MLIRPSRLPDRHPPLPSGQSLNPATTSHHARLSFTGHQQGFTHVHPSGLPFAHAAGMEPAALRLPPELRTPPSPATHVRGRDRPSSTDLELPLNSHPSISNPVVHSMRATSRRTANRRCAAARRLETRFHFRRGITSVVRWRLCPEAAAVSGCSAVTLVAASRGRTIVQDVRAGQLARGIGMASARGSSSFFVALGGSGRAAFRWSQRVLPAGISESWVDGFALEREHSEDAFVHPSQRLAG